MNQPTSLRVLLLIIMLVALFWGRREPFATALARSAQAGAPLIGLRQAEAPSLTVADGLSVPAGHAVTVPIAYASHGEQIAAISFSLDFDQACLSFDASDGNGDNVPDAVTSELSPHFSLSVSYDAQDTDGEIDILIADYVPPLATVDDSAQLISMRFSAICQPERAAGQASPINFSDLPAVSFSRSNGQDVSGSAISNSVLILPQADFTPQPTATAPVLPTPTATPVPVVGNSAPLVGNDATVTNEDTAVLIDVLQNDSDPDGDSLTVDILVQPQHGASARNPDNTITYLPQANFFGSDTFSYTASDGRGGALVATVSVTVRAVNDPPVILIAPSDQVNQVGDAVTLLTAANDPDSAADALTYSGQNLPPGVAIDSQSGLISGTLAADAAGTYEVVVAISDSALSDSVQFGWTVNDAEGESDGDKVYLPLVRG